MIENKLLMGNEAIAYGVMEAGVQVATDYPGTSLTEELETLIRQAENCGIYTEWSGNGKDLEINRKTFGLVLGKARLIRTYR